MTRPLYTLGYTGLDPDLILQTAVHYNALVIDTRLAPRSRHSQWDRRALQDALGRHYLWVGECGNVNYANGGNIQIKDLPECLQTIGWYAAEYDTFILLCGCQHHHECHRSTVAIALAEKLGRTIRHLNKSSIESALGRTVQPTLL